MARKRKTPISQIELFPISFVPFEAAKPNGGYRMEYRLQLAANGLDVCSVCNAIKPIDQFYKSSNTNIGRSAECTVCQRQRCSQVRKNNRQFRLERMLSLQAAIFDDMGGVCQLCGIDERTVLEFHHIDPKAKRYNVSQKIGSIANLINPTSEMLLDLREEADRCALLCSNCHAMIEKNAVIVQWKKRTQQNSEIGWSVESQIENSPFWKIDEAILTNNEIDYLVEIRGLFVDKSDLEMVMQVENMIMELREHYVPGFLEAMRWMEQYLRRR